jgi:hypothetical protein
MIRDAMDRRANMADARDQLSEYQINVKIPDEQGRPPAEIAGFLAAILAGVGGLAAAMGGQAAFRRRLKGVDVSLKSMRYGGIGKAHSVTLNLAGFTTWTVVHELAHAWDGVNGWRHSHAMEKSVGAGHRDFIARILHIFQPDNPVYWYLPGNSPPPCGIDRNFNSKEDFAEAVTAHVFPDEARQKAIDRGWPYADPERGYAFACFGDTPRGKFIGQLLETEEPG